MGRSLGRFFLILRRIFQLITGFVTTFWIWLWTNAPAVSEIQACSHSLRINKRIVLANTSNFLSSTHLLYQPNNLATHCYISDVYHMQSNYIVYWTHCSFMVYKPVTYFSELLAGRSWKSVGGCAPGRNLVLYLNALTPPVNGSITPT